MEPQHRADALDDERHAHHILDCMIIESDPSPSAPLSPRLYPDLSTFEATAQQQHHRSGLFQLPLELRQAIYLKLWHSAGTTQHVFLQDGHYTHAPCITRHDAPDERQVELEELWLRQAPDGAHNFLVIRQPPIVHDIRQLKLACRMMLRGPSRHSDWGSLDTWAELLLTLPTLASLTSVECWLDALILKYRTLFSNSSQPFLAVNADLARMLTVDIPLPEERGLAWEEWPDEAFRIRLRAYPRFRTDPFLDSVTAGKVYRQEAAAQEGVEVLTDDTGKGLFTRY